MLKNLLLKYLTFSLTNKVTQKNYGKSLETKIFQETKEFEFYTFGSYNCKNLPHKKHGITSLVKELLGGNKQKKRS